MAIVGLFCGSDSTKRCKNAAVAFPLISDWLVWGGNPGGCRTPAHRCGVRCVPAPEALGGLRAQGAPRGGGGGRRRRDRPRSPFHPAPRRAVCARRGARAAAACEQPGLAATVRRARGSERAVWRRESTPQRGPPSLRGGRRPFRQQVVQLAGWQRDMPSGGSSIIRRCTAGTSRGRHWCRRRT